MAESGRTEKATPKKRSDERKKGNIFYSRDVTNAVGFIAVVFVLKLLINPAIEYIKSLIVTAISALSSTETLGVSDASTIISKFTISLIILAAPTGILAAAAGIIFTGIQTGFLVNGKKLRPKFSRMNPGSGLKRMFSAKSAVELLKSLLKVAIIAAVVYSGIKNLLGKALQTSLLDPWAAFGFIGSGIYDIAINVSVYLALFAAADYFYQWRTYEKDLMMTRQEIKDEYKQTEGDPQIKSRIKDIQRKIANMRMMKKVETADFVVKNPTHYAVALKYKPPKDKAPLVVAKGKDYLALRIIEEAEKHGIYVTENRPLAKAMYEGVELDSQIPEEFYKPVADILAFIYNLKKNKNVK